MHTARGNAAPFVSNQRADGAGRGTHAAPDVAERPHQLLLPMRLAVRYVVHEGFKVGVVTLRALRFPSSGRT